MMRRRTRSDQWIYQFDRALRTLAPPSTGAQSPMPVPPSDEALTAFEAHHVAGVMRVNHSGEVCLQGLYQGQRLFAQRPDASAQMEHSASNDLQHLAFCGERLRQLDSRTSLLAPCFYIASLSIGAATGALSERLGLGVLAASETQAAKRLSEQLEQLPTADHTSQTMLNKMKVAKNHHAQLALEAGGLRLPAPVQWLMRGAFKAVSKTTYHG
ncbi:2-polyprenyl-3-methyl-6-methoxy-1,4-benzoquinone monooxygenase [Halomonas sp. HL-93]|uniref:2-polyprenyl-3-methyl-6-methoxy-1,4-benzoquinone monooxygenase n=1 Tax=Halomonas sp. HL-93 TaxID=1666906 RepID=UPI0006DA6F29|nr:2-polyprenyl-3-methyl-6-methoxy-1,4-benzoquinone monooxygenase [Halomonas sp. HL-93]KPQ29745.1 MAG: ubiquinone biosynthesis monooxygenase Coq7 [Halomonas sp. HL-93]SBR50326.1 ubiquinone biosynthesis monooxygenase Coq7 [Halomonas sp. HL-93]